MSNTRIAGSDVDGKRYCNLYVNFEDFEKDVFEFSRLNIRIAEIISKEQKRGTTIYLPIVEIYNLFEKHFPEEKFIVIPILAYVKDGEFNRFCNYQIIRIAGVQK